MPGPQLAEDLQDELLRVPTEGAWLDLLDARQAPLVRDYVFHQAVSEAFNRPMEANRWRHEDRQGLELPNSDRWVHEQARREVDRRAQAARVQVPVVAWFAGHDTATARALAKPLTQAGDALFGAP